MVLLEGTTDTAYSDTAMDGHVLRLLVMKLLLRGQVLYDLTVKLFVSAR